MVYKVVLILFLAGGLYAEPFVYGGASSGSSKQIKRNKNSIYRLRQEISRLREEIEGLRSIVEGLNSTIRKLQTQKDPANSAAINDMANLLDKINQNYVSKEEMRRALKVSTSNSTTESKKEEKTPNEAKKSSKKSGLTGASSSALYSKGVRLVNKKRYTDAKKRFDLLSERGYKKASTHFYLGEIAYHTGKYSKAVEEYKKSAELNDNAGYMDKLLLHTGISLQKSGDEDQARRFFQAIVDGYPNTASAKIAKKYL